MIAVNHLCIAFYHDQISRNQLASQRRYSSILIKAWGKKFFKNFKKFEERVTCDDIFTCPDFEACSATGDTNGTGNTKASIPGESYVRDCAFRRLGRLNAQHPGSARRTRQLSFIKQRTHTVEHCDGQMCRPLLYGPESVRCRFLLHFFFFKFFCCEQNARHVHSRLKGKAAHIFIRAFKDV